MKRLPWLLSALILGGPASLLRGSGPRLSEAAPPASLGESDSQAPEENKHDVVPRREKEDALSGTATDPHSSYTPAQRQAYEQRIQLELTELHRRLEDLRWEAQSGGRTAKADTQVYLQMLTEKETAAQRALEQLRLASESRWVEARSHVDAALYDFWTAYDRVRDYLQHSFASPALESRARPQRF
jgi:hypothetical protein